MAIILLAIKAVQNVLMRGIMFTSFLEMVEADFGYVIVDKIIESSDLASEGIYTSVGYYEDEEFEQLLANLSAEVSIDAQVLLITFGKHLFTTLLDGYAVFFTAFDNVLDFLSAMNSYLRVDGMKLYPDMTPPSFECTTYEDGSLELVYSSERKLSFVVKGFIEKMIVYYGTPYKLEMEEIGTDGRAAKFIVSKQDDGRS